MIKIIIFMKTNWKLCSLSRAAFCKVYSKQIGILGVKVSHDYQLVNLFNVHSKSILCFITHFTKVCLMICSKLY